MKTLLTIQLLAGLFLAGPIFGRDVATNAVYPLMAWDYVDDAETLKDMSDCGVTCVAFIRPNLLDACEKYHLKAIVFDEKVTGDDYGKPFDAELAEKNLPALIKKVNKHPAVMGYHLRDEPGATEFPALGRAVEIVKKLAPGKWPYINLFPGMGADYDTYLEQFATVCKPTAYSYDNYPLGEDGKFSYGFWANIAQVREAASAIAEQATKMTELVRRLLDFARRKPPKAGRVDVGVVVGRALVGAILEAFTAREAPRVVLSTAARNETARAFFEGLGFRETMVELTRELP